MKKTAYIMTALLFGFPAMGGDIAPVTVSSIEELPGDSGLEYRSQKQPVMITLQAGIMHTEVGYYDEGDKSANLPSLLYGARLGAKWHFANNERVSHTAGLSIGYYSGSDESFYLWESEPGAFASPDSGSFIDSEVSVIPVTLSYDMEYELTEKLYVYAGARAGAMIRKTSVKNSYDNSVYGMHTLNDSSTKIVPMLGVGVGARAYVSENLSFELSYDFAYTFGKDSDEIRSQENPEWRLYDIGESSRYYGTISAGFTYSF